MNNYSFSQKIYSFLVSLYKWYLRTQERSLDEAYNAALHIKNIEDEHFGGNKINIASSEYSSVNDYFESDLRKHLKIVRMRLTEFNASRFFLNESNQKGATKYNVEFSNPAQVLEKLQFIDEITAKYADLDFEDEATPVVNNELQVNNQLQVIDKKPTLAQTRLESLEIKTSNQAKRGKTNSTGVLPRSLLSTITRLQVELDPSAEQDIVQNFRKAQRRTIISVRFILLLIIVPILTHQLSKAFIVGPVVEHWRNSPEVAIFINNEMQEEALVDLHRFEKVKKEAEEIAQEYRTESANAIKNVFADICSVFAFSWLLIISKREIGILKDFFDHVVYGLSDSAKAFIIILFTDIFVGFHSPHGWEVILAGISHHWGLPENESFIFLFIATFPVILDTIFKYWIFRYLNRVSPSAVATYRNMNE
jgi:CemA family